MSVDIKSLRIGSHILVDGKRVRVMAIDALNRMIGINAYQTDDNGVKHPFGYEIEEVEAIPIIPELLKELGFEFRKSAGGSWYISDKKGGYFYATVCSDSTCVVTHYPDFGFQSRVVCTYLHELEAFAYLISQTELISD